MTPSLKDFFVFDSVSLNKTSINAYCEDIIQDISHFVQLTRIKNCAACADSMLKFIYKTEYSFIKEYGIYFLYTNYYRGECVFLNPNEVFSTIAHNKDFPFEVRKRAIIYLNKRAYNFDKKDYYFYQELLKYPYEKYYGESFLLQLHYKTYNLFTKHELLLKRLKKLKLDDTKFIDTMYFKKQGDILLYGKINKVKKRGISTT